MGRAREAIAAPSSRLLTPAEAAGYCRLSKPLFDSTCRVRPLSFGDGRVIRYDRLDLDAWIEALKSGGVETDEEILDRLG